MLPTDVGQHGAMNAVQLRCLAVLRGSRANEELRNAAERLLASGGVAKPRGRQVSIAAAPPATKGTRDKSWSCAQCTLTNADSAPACLACEQPRSKRAATIAADSWPCPQCTLANAASRRKCSACDTKRPAPLKKRRPVAADGPEWVSSDDDAFAVPAKRRGKSDGAT